MNQGEQNIKKFNINPETGNVENNDDNQSELIFEEVGTFCKAGSTSGGVLEIDLRSMKQKGTEERFISVKVIGFNDQNEVSQAEMLLLNEEQFKKLKEFITKLDWND